MVKLGRDRNQGSIRGGNLPPQSIEAEQSVLGALLLSPEAWDRIAGKLEEHSFYRRDHQIIFRAIKALAERDEPRDIITVVQWIEDNRLIESIGGKGAYVVELASTTPSAANILAYAEIVADKATLRALADAGTGIATDAYRPDGRETSELLASAEQAVFRIAEGQDRGRNDVVDVNVALSQAFRVLQDRYEAGGNITGVPTGYEEFDDITAGLQPTDLIILAARPSMGKTSLAMGMAEYAALAAKKAVAVFSMEMSANQLALRLISSVGRVNSQRLRTGQLEDEDWNKVTAAVSRIKDAKIFIDDTPALTPEQLRSRARRLKREHNLGLIVVDYLQLMHVPGKSESRTNEITEISRSLKAVAKELNVPVIALSQLNRSLETRADKRPIMADLRESGAIEQDADVVAFIYRDEYYNKESADKGLAEVIIAKQRNGPTGTVKLRFDGAYTAFANLSQD